jgi:3-oxoacyl-(acyl-carrier-protein) synthase
VTPPPPPTRGQPPASARHRALPLCTCRTHALRCSLIDKKNARRYDDCLKYTMVSGKKALAQAGLDKEANASAFSQLNLNRCGILVGSGMGGLSVFQDGEEWAPRLASWLRGCVAAWACGQA